MYKGLYITQCVRMNKDLSSRLTVYEEKTLNHSVLNQSYIDII